MCEFMSVVPNQDHVVLLTTQGCSLCEKAKVELWPVLSRHQLKVLEWDIINHAYLLNTFSVHIPVLVSGDVLKRFNWLIPESPLESITGNDTETIPLVDTPVGVVQQSIRLEDTCLYWPFSTEDIENWLSQIKDL